MKYYEENIDEKINRQEIVSRAEYSELSSEEQAEITEIYRCGACHSIHFPKKGTPLLRCGCGAHIIPEHIYFGFNSRGHTNTGYEEISTPEEVDSSEKRFREQYGNPEEHVKTPEEQFDEAYPDIKIAKDKKAREAMNKPDEEGQ